MTTWRLCGFFCVLCIGLIGLGLKPAVGQDSKNPATAQFGASGLPLPRFVSLAAVEVNLRVGPGDRFPIEWIYRRQGLPVEVINEHDVWRQIRDHEDTVGWVHQSLLTGRRRVLIIGGLRSLRASPDPAAPAVARLEAGVIGALSGCSGAWCQIEVKRHSGWLRREEVYGLYPNEQIR